MGSKKAFWQALVFTIIVFALGLILGYFLEVKESDSLYYKIVDSEISILDEELRTRILEDYNVDCNIAKQNLFNFADKIYVDAQYLEEVNTKGRLIELNLLHKRYDALRTLLWLESNKLKEKCNNNFHILTYLYQYNSEDLDIQGKQSFYSKLLFDLKLENPENIILIPIAADTGLDSVNLIADVYSIREFPVIIIDGTVFLYDIITFEELDDMVKNIN